MKILKAIEELQKIAKINPEVDLAIPDSMDGGFIELERIELVEEDGELFVELK
jgi:hypothetical protein